MMSKKCCVDCDKAEECGAACLRLGSYKNHPGITKTRRCNRTEDGHCIAARCYYSKFGVWSDGKSGEDILAEKNKEFYLQRVREAQGQ